jgi:glycerol uptake facilitator-like aquaporin
MGEFLGTYWLVFILQAISLNGALMLQPKQSWLISLGSALSLTSLCYSFSDVSGAHFNPAITFATIITGKMSWRAGLAYLFVHLLSSIAATATSLLLFSNNEPKLIKNITEFLVADIPENVSYANALLMELFCSLVLSFVIFATAFDERKHLIVIKII